jgi:hypothetical protein
VPGPVIQSGSSALSHTMTTCSSPLPGVDRSSVVLDVGCGTGPTGARAGALAALRASVDAHVTPGGVQYNSGLWLVTAVL